MPADWRGIDVTLLLEDGDGRLHKVEGTTAGLMTGAGQRIEVPLTADLDGQRVAFPGPAKLAGVELSFRMPSDMTGIGTLDVLGVDASDSPTGDADWRDIGWKPSTDGFHWTAIRSGSDRGVPAAARLAEPDLVRLRRGPDRTDLRRRRRVPVPVVDDADGTGGPSGRRRPDVPRPERGEGRRDGRGLDLRPAADALDRRRDAPVPLARPGEAVRDRRRDVARAGPPGRRPASS